MMSRRNNDMHSTIQQQQKHEHEPYDDIIRYGQIVVGPPGSGKTTYCHGIQQYLELLQRQNVCLFNFDPAATNNTDDIDDWFYDVGKTTICLSKVMDEFNLGPNGGLIYCMEYIQKHLSEIIHEHILPKLRQSESTSYFILDMPGQVELYTYSNCVSEIVNTLAKCLNIRFTVVQLIDSSQACHNISQFVSSALLHTTSMIQFELPTINVLSKIDLLLSSHGRRIGSGRTSDDNDNPNDHDDEDDYVYDDPLPMDLEYFANCQDLMRLIPYLQDDTATTDGNNVDEMYLDDPEYVCARKKRFEHPLALKYRKLHAGIAELVDDFNLLKFELLDIQNGESVGHVLAQIDKCNGYLFTTEQQQTNTTNNSVLFQCAATTQSSATDRYEMLSNIREHG